MDGSRIDAMHRYLWLSVIERAYQDAEGMDPMVEGPELVAGIRAEAREWLCSEEFLVVGELTGVVRDKIERKLEENKRKYGAHSRQKRDNGGFRKASWGNGAMETGGCGTDETDGVQSGAGGSSETCGGGEKGTDE